MMLRMAVYWLDPSIRYYKEYALLDLTAPPEVKYIASHRYDWLRKIVGYSEGAEDTLDSCDELH